MTRNASRMAATSPRSSVLGFAADKRAPFLAREETRKFLLGFAAGEEIRDAQLIVSELVTNSVLAYKTDTENARVSLSLRAVDTHLFISVIDSAPGFPEFSEPGTGSIHGYGLFLVEQLSQRHGWFFMSGGQKCTYCILYRDRKAGGNGQ